MVYRYISPDMKRRALFLIQNGRSMEDIVEALGVSSRSVTRWEDNYEDYGCVNRPSAIRGRPRTLDTFMTEDLRQLIDETPSLFLDEIGEWLAIYHDQPISTTALHMNLQDLGLTRKRLRRIAAERDEIARAEWRHEIAVNYTADQMVFS